MPRISNAVLAHKIDDLKEDLNEIKGYSKETRKLVRDDRDTLIKFGEQLPYMDRRLKVLEDRHNSASARLGTLFTAIIKGTLALFTAGRFK